MTNCSLETRSSRHQLLGTSGIYVRKGKNTEKCLRAPFPIWQGSSTQQQQQIL